MDNYIKNITGNPAPFLIGAAAGFYIADRKKDSDLMKKILFTAIGGIVVSIAYIGLLDKGGKLDHRADTDIHLPPVQPNKK